MAKPSTKKKVVSVAPVGAAVTPAHNPNLLHEIAATTAHGAIAYHSAIDVAHLVAEGLVEQNMDYRDEHGRIATRATDKGMAHVTALQAVTEVPAQWHEQPASAPFVSASSYAVDTGVELAAVKRNFGGGNREPKYPFDALPAPQHDTNGNLVYASFHVPNSINDKGEEVNAGRAIGSSLAAQNRKYAVETGETKVVVETVYQTGPDGKRVKVDGHYVKMGTQQVEIAVTRQEREFTLRTVGASDPRGPGARVFRIK